MKNLLKKLIKTGFLLALLLTLIIISLNLYYQNKFSKAIKKPEDIATLEHRSTALILGAGLRRDTSPSSILTDRLEIGYRLLQSGKVDKLILSGDNRIIEYNEPDAMKKYLLDKGIDEKKLVLDYAGRRTYDSCYRAKEIFGQQKIYVVTQQFHIMRSVYLCNSLGIDIIGVTSDIQQYRGMWMNYFRDYLSFANAILDIKILHPLPVLGEKVEV